MNLIAYIEPEEAIIKHDEVILISGGLLGLRDKGLLTSTLTMIKNDSYYLKYIDKLTHLIFSINKNHCFIDGNKRLSIALGAIFLIKNGFSYQFVKKFILEMEQVVIWLAENTINKNDLALYISNLICDFEKKIY